MGNEIELSQPSRGRNGWFKAKRADFIRMPVLADEPTTVHVSVWSKTFGDNAPIILVLTTDECLALAERLRKEAQPSLIDVPYDELPMALQACGELIATIDATGGVMLDHDGLTVPVGDREWSDLGEAYLHAKAAWIEAFPEYKDDPDAQPKYVDSDFIDVDAL